MSKRDGADARGGRAELTISLSFRFESKGDFGEIMRCSTPVENSCFDDDDIDFFVSPVLR